MNTTLLTGKRKRTKSKSNDFFPTPSECTRAVLNALPHLPTPIWEPACGDGAICRVLEEFGYTLKEASDLIDRGYGRGGVDFLSLRPVLTPHCGTIITNPPYKLARPFVDLALEYAQTVVMLCKLKLFSRATPRALVGDNPIKNSIHNPVARIV